MPRLPTMSGGHLDRTDFVAFWARRSGGVLRARLASAAGSTPTTRSSWQPVRRPVPVPGPRERPGDPHSSAAVRGGACGRRLVAVPAGHAADLGGGRNRASDHTPQLDVSVMNGSADAASDGLPHRVVRHAVCRCENDPRWAGLRRAAAGGTRLVPSSSKRASLTGLELLATVVLLRRRVPRARPARGGGVAGAVHAAVDPLPTGRASPPSPSDRRSSATTSFNVPSIITQCGTSCSCSPACGAASGSCA